MNGNLFIDDVDDIFAFPQLIKRYKGIVALEYMGAGQGNGIATRLIDFAVDYMKGEGMEMCIIDTGQDPGHESARATYEKNNFDMWPVARFYKEI